MATAQASTAAPGALPAVQVKFSQDSLFYPLPFTNATIENVVQVKNVLPPDPTQPRVNVVAFKVLSAVQHRYSVRPPIGFVPPGEAITINFALDPESIRRHKDSASRVLPTKDTKDAIFVDLAVVSPGDATAFATWDPAKKDLSTKKEAQECAAAFWKEHGQVKVKGPGVVPSDKRKKLNCVFAEPDHVPESLVMCMKTDNKGDRTLAETKPSSAAAAVDVPKSRLPPSSTNSGHRTAPPESPPHLRSTGSEGGQPAPGGFTPIGASLVNANNRSSGSAGSPSPRRLSTPLPPSTPSPQPPYAGSPMTATDPDTPLPGSTAARAGSAKAIPTLNAAVAKAKVAEAAEALASKAARLKHDKPVIIALWKQVLNYKVPVLLAVAFLVLAVLCGLFEEDTFFSWLITGS